MVHILSYFVFFGIFNICAFEQLCGYDVTWSYITLCVYTVGFAASEAQQLQVAQATKREDDLTIVGLRREMDKGAARADMLSVREKAAQRLVGELQQVRKSIQKHDRVVQRAHRVIHKYVSCSPNRRWKI